MAEFSDCIRCASLLQLSRAGVPKLRPAGRIRPSSTFGPAPWTMKKKRKKYYYFLMKIFFTSSFLLHVCVYSIQTVGLLIVEDRMILSFSFCIFFQWNLAPGVFTKPLIRPPRSRAAGVLWCQPAGCADLRCHSRLEWTESSESQNSSH